MNWYLICTLWFLVMGLLGMTVLDWSETTVTLLLAVANVWAAAGNVRDDVVRAIREEGAK